MRAHKRSIADDTDQEWEHGLRSSLHPWLFAGVYRIAHYAAQILGLHGHHRAELLVVAPRVAQALIAATADLYTWRLARLMPGISVETADIAVSRSLSCLPQRLTCPHP